MLVVLYKLLDVLDVLGGILRQCLLDGIDVLDAFCEGNFDVVKPVTRTRLSPAKFLKASHRDHHGLNQWASKSACDHGLKSRKSIRTRSPYVLQCCYCSRLRASQVARSC